MPYLIMVEGEGFEPPKAEPADLQSAPVDRLGTPPSGKYCAGVFHTLSIYQYVTKVINNCVPRHEHYPAF